VSLFDQKCSDPLFWIARAIPVTTRAASHLRVTGLARLAVATTQRPQRATNEYYSLSPILTDETFLEYFICFHWNFCVGNHC